jgi:hypothetical protein
MAGNVPTRRPSLLHERSHSYKDRHASWIMVCGLYCQPSLAAGRATVLRTITLTLVLCASCQAVFSTSSPCRPSFLASVRNSRSGGPHFATLAYPSGSILCVVWPDFPVRHSVHRAAPIFAQPGKHYHDDEPSNRKTTHSFPAAGTLCQAPLRCYNTCRPSEGGFVSGGNANTPDGS